MENVLLISGGGSKIVYSIAIINTIIQKLKVNYDLYCGVSAGAIVACFLAQFPEEENELGIVKLTELWNTIKKEHIFKNWEPLGKLQSIYKRSLFDNSPLYSLIYKNISIQKIRASGKKVKIGAININTGKYQIFTEQDDNLLLGILGSCAFPGIFQPTKIKEDSFIDGGFMSPFSLIADNYSNIKRVDVILTSPAKKSNKKVVSPSVIDILNNCVDMLMEDKVSGDIDKILMHNKLVEIGAEPEMHKISLNVIRPEEMLSEKLLDFRDSLMKKMFIMGEKDAEKIFGV